MATKVFFLNSTLADYGEEEFNYLQKFLLQQGILNSQGADYNDFADLKVTQNGGGNMSVNVAVGVAVINTVRSGVTFKVFVSNQAIANIPVANNTTGGNRIDPVILKISRTAEPNALMNNVATLQVLTGTGVSAMTDGAIQSAIGADYDFIRLANLTVANNATQILTANIADTRVRCYSTDVSVPNPTIIKFRQLSADPTTPAEGEMWYNTTANILRYYDGASTINIQASTYTGGNGINVTAGVVSVDLFATFPGLEFSGGKLKAKVGTSEGDLVQLLAGGKLPAVDGSNLVNLPKIFQRIAYYKGTYTGSTTYHKTASSQDGSVFFRATLTADTTLNIQRFQKTSSGQYILTHQTTLAITTFTYSYALAVVGNYLYVQMRDNGGGTRRVVRYAIADLSGVTTMTISGTTYGDGGAMFSDGTDLYIANTVSGANYSFYRYTISGTTITYVSSITYTGADRPDNGAVIANSTHVFMYGTVGNSFVIKKYAIAGGAVVATSPTYITYYDAYPNSGAGTNYFDLIFIDSASLGIISSHTIESATAIIGSELAIDSIPTF